MAEIAVNTVIDKLVPLLNEEAKLLRGIHNDITSIKDLLESMRSFLKDADAKTERGRASSSAETWVKQTREMANHIEDVIDVYLHRVAQRRNKRGFIDFLHRTTHFARGLLTRHDIASEIRLIKESVREIQQRSVTYGFHSTKRISLSSSRQDDPRMASLYTEEADLVGIDIPRNMLIGWSIRGEVASRRSVISIIGMGGLGKTTLAKKVFDDPRFTGQFAFRAWITVSQSYKKEDILRNMITEFHRTRKESVPEGIESMEERLLIETLREYLKEKKYAVVFDDVWSTELWEHVKLALPDNKKGSRIIVTTRKGEVAAYCKEASSDQVYELQLLSQQKARELFYKKTFRDTEGYCPTELKQFADPIVSRCGGLPLAIVAISGLLSTKGGDVSQWRKLHDSLGSELEFNPHLANVTKILSFSYQDLPYQLKPCFLYFGTYPASRTVRCSRLIRQWIAEGFIKEQRDKTLEDVAEEYLTELIQRSLVQVSLTNKWTGKPRECQVHDLMLEAVILLRNGDLRFSQFLKEDSTVNESTRHLSVYGNAYNVLDNIENSRAHSLFLFNGIDEIPKPFTISRNLHKSFKLLRVLDFEDSLIDSLPTEVGHIYHLKYLSLRSTRVRTLPKSMGKLVNLETLDLKQSLVLEIPIEITKLRKLRNLLAYNRDDSKALSLPGQQPMVIREGIECLANMQKLYSVEATDNLVKGVGNLRQLRKFGIQKLRTKHGKDLCTSIGNMPRLQWWEIIAINTDEIIDIQCISSPLQFLQTLSLKGRLEKLPDWIAGLGLLARLILCSSGLAGDRDTIKVLQGLLNLLELYIDGAFRCEELHFEGGFLKLKRLSLRNLSGLKLMTIQNGAFPLLEDLVIGPCPQLQQVPLGIPNLRSFKSVYFWDMPSNFIDGIKVQEAEHSVGPKVYCTNFIPGRGYTLCKLINSPVFV